MKAISLWQPWASLVSIGAKKIETRHWQPPRALIGERIAIHAAKARDKAGQREWCTRAPFDRYVPNFDALPLGAVICTVRLVSCEQITPHLRTLLSEEELAFGNYATGRYAWHLADVVEFPAIPAIGRQGFFDAP